MTSFLTTLGVGLWAGLIAFNALTALAIVLDPDDEDEDEDDGYVDLGGES